MLETIFTFLSTTMNGSAHVAIFSSVLWGIFSIILSPCHLASIPLVVGFIGSQGVLTTRRACVLSTLFALGILFTIAIIGIITGLLGRMLGDIGAWGTIFVSLIFFLIGLHLLGVIPLPFVSSGVNQPQFQKKGLWAAFVLGLIFGIALGPCTFAFMMPMLGVVFTVAKSRFLFACSLIIAYGIGHCSVIVLAGTSIKVVQKFLHWNQQSLGLSLLKKICGVLVILGGIYLLGTLV